MIKNFKAIRELKIPFTILIVVIVALMLITPVSSKSSKEIGEEIDQKEEELAQLEKDLNEARELVSYYKGKKDSASSELERTKNEIKQLEAEIEVTRAEANKYNRELELLQLKLSEKERYFDEQMIDFYINHRQGVLYTIFENNGVDGFWKDYKYRESLLDTEVENLNSLSSDVEDLTNQKKKIENILVELEKESESLAKRKEELEGQLSQYDSLASYNQEVQDGIRAKMGIIQTDIDNLSEEQKRMIEQEQNIIRDAAGGTKPLKSGEYYFYGVGRSIYQGHGLGFSQYGAMGGAQKGMGAEEIAKFYYPGTYIGNHVDESVEDRIMYLGEIPDKACGTSQQAQANPEKYATDNPNTIWDCWPEESIKAQIIVARSYAYTGGTQQVYKSYKGKKWAVEETRGKVLKHNTSGYRNGVIKAFFSADNNNGWGTATHKNPVFCGVFSGECGGGFVWLQAVNDSSFAAKGPYTDWTWRTNSYSISELDSMLEWYANQNFTYPYSADVRNLLNNIGELKNLQFERDVSGRVARVNVVGSKGSQKVNGSFFKTIQIFWVYNKTPSGEVDPIFSLTYHFTKVP